MADLSAPSPEKKPGAIDPSYQNLLSTYKLLKLDIFFISYFIDFFYICIPVAPFQKALAPSS